MDMNAVQAEGARAQALAQALVQGAQAHPYALGVALLLLLFTWSHFRGSYGPQTLALAKDRPKVLRGLVYVLVIPLRLLASVFSSAVALLVIGLLLGFCYVVWRVAQG